MRLIHGDCLEAMRELPDGAARCCVTSPPYYGLRDYGEPGQVGLEATTAAYVAKLVAVFREVWRVLADDGTLWLNLGDSYSSPPVGRFNGGGAAVKGRDLSGHETSGRIDKGRASGLGPKQLLGIPWRVAFALQDDGWILRSDIIWSKPAVMPESVRDRPTKAHEYLFLLSKSERYYYDADAVREPIAEASRARITQTNFTNQTGGPKDYGTNGVNPNRSMRRTLENFAKNPERGRNRRTVWTIATKPYRGAHFAVMPEALVEPCILAGSAAGDTILDPFCGSGTVGAVAVKTGRDFIGVDLNAEYLALAERRIAAAQPPLFAEVAD